MRQETLLLKQGEAIARAIEGQGYQTRHLAGCDLIAWEVTKKEEEFWLMLTWLPRPVAQWRFLPAASDDRQQQLYSIVEQTIGGRR